MARPASVARAAAKAARATQAGPAPLLLLPPATGDLPEDGGVVLACNAEVVRKNVEHCGHAYHRLVLTKCGLAKEEVPEETKVKKTGSGGSDEEEHAGAALKKLLSKDSDDLYDLLELGDLRWRATADDIKKSFRKFSLMYHPDKVSHLGKEALEDSETHFKKVKKAYDILADKKKRASYDSIDDVDDSIPSDNSVNEKNFYAKLRPVFELNARWSSANRVPSLGDKTTSIDEVNKFYDFWYSFKTWRDFSFDLEYDTDQAECREEKRWMDRQNQKHVKARKLEEAARIRKLVDVAYKNDPRVRKAKDEVKARKEAAKLERLRAREATAEAEQREAAAKKAEEERKEAEAKDSRARAKKDKEAARQVMRRARQKLRGAVREGEYSDNVDVSVAVERCCGELPAVAIEMTANTVSAAKGEPMEKLLQLLGDALKADYSAQSGDAKPDGTSSAKTDEPASTPAPVPKPPAEAKPVQEEVQWKPEEMKRLTKALSKFPPGTRDRYEKLASFVGSRDSASCLAMVNASRARNIGAAGSLNGVRRPAVASDSSDYERFQREKKKCNVVDKNPPSSTYNSAATPVQSDVESSGPSLDEPAKPAAEPENTSSKPTGNKPPNAMRFTPKQQTQLEAAMKKYPSTLGDLRWTKISGDVSSRNADECQKRVAELISFYKARGQQKTAKK